MNKYAVLTIKGSIVQTNNKFNRKTCNKTNSNETDKSQLTLRPRKAKKLGHILKFEEKNFVQN